MMCAPTNKGLQTLISRLIVEGWTKDDLVVEGGKTCVRPEIREYCLDYRLDRFKQKKKELKQELKKVGKVKAKQDATVKAMVREYQHLHQKLTGVVCQSQRMRNRFVYFLCAAKRTNAGTHFNHTIPLPKVVAQFIGLFDQDFQFPLKPKPNKRSLLSKARLLACTVNAAARRSLIGVKTPTIIMDEAAQCNEAESLIVASRTGLKRLVLVGDPNQLPALVNSPDVRKCNYEVSMMERVMRSGTTLSLLLEKQYRMHPQISMFPRNEYYEGALVDAKEVVDRSVGQILEPYVLIDVHGEEECCERSYFNHAEARVVCTEIDAILQVIPQADIGVVTPYKAQQRLLENRLAVPNIQVNTVDGFQGAELDVVVLSMVRSNDKGNVGFLGNHRRLNVALTRSKSVLRVIGNFATLRTNKVLGSMVSDAEKRGLIRRFNQDGKKKIRKKKAEKIKVKATTKKKSKGKTKSKKKHKAKKNNANIDDLIAQLDETREREAKKKAKKQKKKLKQTCKTGPSEDKPEVLTALEATTSPCDQSTSLTEPCAHSDMISSNPLSMEDKASSKSESQSSESATRSSSENQQMRACDEGKKQGKRLRTTTLKNYCLENRSENVAQERPLSAGAKFLLHMLENYAKDDKHIVRLSLIGSQLKEQFTGFTKGCVRMFVEELIQIGLVQRQGRAGLASICLTKTTSHGSQSQRRIKDTFAVASRAFRKSGKTVSEPTVSPKTKRDVLQNDENDDAESGWQIVRSRSKKCDRASRGTITPEFLADLKQSFPDLWRFYKRVADSAPNPKYEKFWEGYPPHIAFWLTRLLRDGICTRLNHINGRGCYKKSACSFAHECIVCGGNHGAFEKRPCGDWVCREYSKVLEQVQRASKKYGMDIKKRMQEHIKARGVM